MFMSPLRLTFLITAYSTFTFSHAQSTTLWGMTATGGTSNKGTIFHIDPDGTDFTVVHQFDDASGWNAEGTLCAAPNGKLYGTTLLGGSGSPAQGTLFSFDPTTSTYSVLQNFDGTTGGNGYSGMVLGNDGLLYGAGFVGSSGGSIFSVDPATDSYTNRHLLDAATDGSGINDRLFQAPDGWFYGVAAFGGANQAGTLFRFDPTTDTFEKLHDFDGGLGGSIPYGTPCLAGDGWFYGTTWEGGTSDKGILFRYNAITDVFQKMKDFNGVNGESPWGGPIVAGPDLLFGTAALGGSGGAGLIYRYVPSTNTLTEEFGCTFAVGGTLFGNVMLGSDGALYGLASFGGSTFGGTVYRIDPVTHVQTTLHEFLIGTEGNSPRGDLIEVDAGTTGLIDRNEGTGFQVYPNPTKGSVMVTTDHIAHAQLSVMNSLGQLVQDRAITATMTSVELPAVKGIYTLKLRTGSKLITRRVVVE